MALFVWKCLFAFLGIETVIVVILSLKLNEKLFEFVRRPLKRIVSNRKILYIILVLLFIAFLESLLQQYAINKKISKVKDEKAINPQLSTSLDSERFRIERNLYISGFSLLLMFVIWRLVELHKEINDKNKKSNNKEKEIKIKQD